MNGTANPTRWTAVLKRQGRSLRWLAETTGYSYSYAAKLSSGSLRPSPEFLRRVSGALGEEVTA